MKNITNMVFLKCDEDTVVFNTATLTGTRFKVRCIWQVTVFLENLKIVGFKKSKHADDEY